MTLPEHDVVGPEQPLAAAAECSLKRPVEDVKVDEDASSKRQKLGEEQAAEVDADMQDEVRQAEDAQPEAEAAQTGGAGDAKGKGDKRGGGDKRRQKGGKKGKDKEYVRTRRRGTRPDGEEAPAPENGEPKAPRLPKRPVALLIGFCGDGYNGMQMCVTCVPRPGRCVRVLTEWDAASRTQTCAPSRVCYLMHLSRSARCPRTTRITRRRCVSNEVGSEGGP